MNTPHLTNGASIGNVNIIPIVVGVVLGGILIIAFVIIRLMRQANNSRNKDIELDNGIIVSALQPNYGRIRNANPDFRQYGETSLAANIE